MQRRIFIKNSSLFAVGVGVFGNIRWDNNHFEGINPTTTDILGPFYRPGAPLRSNIIPAGTQGELMHLSGTILKDDGKTLYKDCLVEIWQCSPDGIYDNTSDDYKFRGAQKTGSDGKYHFTTCIPVPYATDEQKKTYRPAHIHLRISGKDEQDLVTQIYFKGDPYIETDYSSKSPQSISRILEVKKNGKKENSIQFDIVMAKEFSLDNAVFEKITGLYQLDDHSMVEFYKNDDLLFVKVNGQIMEALYYKGNNRFAAPMDTVKVQFELQEKGEVKVIADYFTDNDGKNWVKSTGKKILKYK